MPPKLAISKKPHSLKPGGRTCTNVCTSSYSGGNLKAHEVIKNELALIQLLRNKSFCILSTFVFILLFRHYDYVTEPGYLQLRRWLNG